MLFADFLTHVLPSVAGCPDQVALDHIIKAARIYCARTLCLSYETAPTLTVAGQSIYPIDLDQSQERVKLLKAWVDGIDTPVFDAMNGRNLARRQSPRSFVYMDTALDLVVYPTPTVNGIQVITQLAVKPAMSATYWPDELAESVTDIAHGAIATLCLLPRQEWSNTALAGEEQGMFMQRMGTVGFNVSRGYSTTAKRGRVSFL